MIAVSFVVAGLGNALFDPALSAAILDVATHAHEARVLGFKRTGGTLGDILQPGLPVLFTTLFPDM